MATHSCILAWKIARTEETGRLQSMGSQRVTHNWATSLHFVPGTKEKVFLKWWSDETINYLDNFLRKLILVYGKDNICTIPNTDISVRVNTLACEIIKMHLTCLGWKSPQHIKVVQKGTVTIRINSIQWFYRLKHWARVNSLLLYHFLATLLYCSQHFQMVLLIANSRMFAVLHSTAYHCQSLYQWVYCSECPS